MAEQIRSSQAISGKSITAAMADNPVLLRSLTDAEIEMLIAMVETEEIEDKKNIGDYAAQGLDMAADAYGAFAPVGGAIVGGTAGSLAGIPTGGLGALAGTPTGIALGGAVGQGAATGVKAATSAITKGVHEDRLKRVGGGERKRHERLARLKAVQRQRLTSKEDRDKLRRGYQEMAGQL